MSFNKELINHCERSRKELADKERAVTTQGITINQLLEEIENLKNQVEQGIQAPKNPLNDLSSITTKTKETPMESDYDS